MPTTDLTRQFVQLLDESGLTEERKQYWIAKISKADFSEEDRKVLTDELTVQLDLLDDAIAFTEGEITEKEAKIADLKTTALPYLKRVAAAQPALLEEEAKTYKNTVKTAENEMMAGLKQVRTANNSQEIEAIRKKLGSN